MENLDQIFAEMQNEETSYTPADGYKQIPYSDNAVVYIDNKSIGSLTDQISISGEADSQYITFETERFADGIDLRNKLIQVHYERKDGISDNCGVVNVEYSDTHIRFGWLIPAKAVAVNGILRIMPFAHGVTPDGDTYVLKNLYAEYTVQEGLAVDEGIEEPEEDWYMQFLEKMEYFLDESVSAQNKAETAEENASASAEQAIEAQEAAQTSAGAASVHETNAQSARDTAVQSAAQAKKYFENTKQLSMTNVGDVLISIDAEKKCLVAQYMEAEGEELPDDWYTEFLKQISAWLEQTRGSALAAKNSENAAKESEQNAAGAENAAVGANQSAQQAKTECLNASGAAQAAANTAKTYYEQTKALSTSSIGDVVFAVDAQRKCLTATYDD